MFEVRRVLSQLLLVVGLVCFAAACSDDTDTGSQGGEQECEAGEEVNPLSGKCEPRASGNNTTPNNTTPNNTSGDAGNNTTDDGGGNNNHQRDVPEGCGPGDVIGTACAPSGEILVGATVAIEGFDCDGNEFRVETTTNGEGEYQFSDVPSGQHTLSISSGSFNRDQPIIVQNGQTLDLGQSNSKVCLEGGNVKIAVIEGAYDHVAGILDDLQLDYDIRGDDQQGGGPFNPQPPPESHAFLMDLNEMKTYDIIFINCGELWNVLERTASGDLPTIVSNLKAYVDDGNSLYASDWSHPFIQNIYPQAVDFLGNDSNINEARRGYAPQTIQADVPSQRMQTLLGHDQATIDFPHDPNAGVINTHWVVAEGADSTSTTFLSGDAKLCTRGFDGTQCQSGGGTQVDSPLLISFKPSSGGTVIYTAFHNERQHSLNDDMEKIMRFLIFQL